MVGHNFYRISGPILSDFWVYGRFLPSRCTDASDEFRATCGDFIGTAARIPPSPLYRQIGFDRAADFFWTYSIAKLKERNEGFNGDVKETIEDGVVGVSEMTDRLG